jgi:hypothetical protein
MLMVKATTLLLALVLLLSSAQALTAFDPLVVVF